MNSVDPFTSTVDKKVIMANVKRWRVEHGKPIADKWINPPRIIASKKVVVTAVDAVMGKEGK